MRVKFRDLPPEIKLEALRLWMHYKIDKWPGKGRFKKLSAFFNERCRHLVQGEREKAFAEANVCYYCSRPFNFLRTKTRDHFYPRPEWYSITTNKYVIACYKCNHWKGDKHPNQIIEMLLNMIDTGKNFDGLKPVEMTGMVARVQAIVHDIHGSKGPLYYFLKIK